MAKQKNNSNSLGNKNKLSITGEVVNLSLPDFKYTPPPPKNDSDKK